MCDYVVTFCPRLQTWRVDFASSSTLTKDKSATWFEEAFFSDVLTAAQQDVRMTE